jgi:hypothetical protein
MFFLDASLTQPIQNYTPVIHLDISEVKNMTDSGHDNSMEDTLEAEISKLETIINDLEVDNLPDIDSCPHNSEDDMLNPAKYNFDDASGIILNTASHKKENEPKPLINLIDSVKPCETLQASDLIYSSEPKTYQKCLVEHQKTEESNKADMTFIQGLKVNNKVMSNSLKSMIISNKCEEVSLTSQNCELGTNDNMVHLNSVNETGIAFTTGHGKNAEKSKTHSLLIDKSINTALAKSLFENGNDSAPQKSHLQVDASEFEDEVLYPDDTDGNDVACSFAEINDEPVVSSTPLRIKPDPQKLWKAKFLHCEESFLVLDESGECSEQEESVGNYSLLQNTSIQSVAAAYSTEPTSFTNNSLFLKVKEDSNIGDVKVKGNNDMKQIQVPFDDARDLKIVVKVGDEVNNDSLHLHSAWPPPVWTNAAYVQGHGIQEIVPVMKTKNTERVEWETRDTQPLANICTDQVNSDSEAIMRTAKEFSGNSTNNVPEGNALVSTFPSDSTDQNLLDQKQKLISKSVEDYVSNNSQENYDNNNPDWELLRKLETDEERYRAMRQRWRNLAIPNPNQDLTCRNWRIHQNANKLAASTTSTSECAIIQSTCANESGTSVSTPNCHKRTLEWASTEHQPRLKRSRTQSCTAVYDIKLEQLRNNIKYEMQQIYNQEQFALMQLDIKQTQEMNYLQNFCHTYDINEQKRRLYYQQQWVGIYRCSFYSVNKSLVF